MLSKGSKSTSIYVFYVYSPKVRKTNQGNLAIIQKKRKTGFTKID